MVSAVSHEVGVGVGCTDGPEVGVIEGFAEGLTVGSTVGLTVGFVDGLFVGSIVVGRSVGAADGLSVGSVVGLIVGSLVGFAVVSKYCHFIKFQKNNKMEWIQSVSLENQTKIQWKKYSAESFLECSQNTMSFNPFHFRFDIMTTMSYSKNEIYGFNPFDPKFDSKFNGKTILQIQWKKYSAYTFSE